jgi:protein SCO1/2
MLLAWFACAPEPPTYTVTGTVVEVRSDREVVIAHDPIPGFMDAMTMPFQVEPGLLQGVDPGDIVQGTLVVGSPATRLTALGVTREHEAPAERPPDLQPGEHVPEGALFPQTPVMLAAGGSTVFGEGQEGRVAVTFLYTRCPIPEYCPLTAARFGALQEVLPAGARLLAVTIDPEHDTRSVLRDYAASVGAVPGRWDFGRVPDEVLVGVAEKAGLRTDGKGTGITHDLVVIVLDEQGRLIRRFRDMKWEQDELVGLLRGGAAGGR